MEIQLGTEILSMKKKKVDFPLYRYIYVCVPDLVFAA